MISIAKERLKANVWRSHRLLLAIAISMVFGWVLYCVGHNRGLGRVFEGKDLRRSAYSALTIRLSSAGGTDTETLLLADQTRIPLAGHSEERLASQLAKGDQIPLKGGGVGRVESLRRVAFDPIERETRPSSHASSAVPARVVATVSRQTSTVVRVGTSAGVITTTPEHLFAKVGGRWTPAAKLSVGDRVTTTGADRSVEVLAIDIDERSTPVQVFNLSVEGTHAFFWTFSRCRQSRLTSWLRKPA